MGEARDLSLAPDTLVPGAECRHMWCTWRVHKSHFPVAIEGSGGGGAAHGFCAAALGCRVIAVGSRGFGPLAGGAG